MADISEKALKLILDAEGLDQPGAWPGGQSGVSIGIGYDLGYMTADEFESDWNDFLPAATIERLKAAIGLKAAKAKNIAPRFADIRIKRADAEKVFTQRTLPKYQRMARSAFPGLEKLPRDAQGALVSLVFNRGTNMAGDRRREMRAIRTAVAAEDLPEIARQLRSMKRLWEGKGLDGLLKRREAEAALVESSIA